MPSKIEYVDETWNPVTGCTKISPGCQNCYAERMARRLAGRFGYPEAPRHFDVTLHPDRLDEPLRRKKPTRYLMCSMGDLFHRDMTEDFVNEGFLADVFNMMQTCNDHTFLVLTKRPKRMAEFVEAWRKPYSDFRLSVKSTLPNVWLGVTVESQDEMWRVEELLKIPAAKHWVSIEPMLGPIEDLSFYLKRCEWCERNRAGVLDPRCRDEPNKCYRRTWSKNAIDFVVLGGETGPKARPMHPQWPRDVRDDCVAAGVDFFFKGWGAWEPGQESTEPFGPVEIGERCVWHNDRVCRMYRVGKKAAGRLLDGRTWNEIPETGV